jgi:5-keto 4-deoxyuronate isomerase
MDPDNIRLVYSIIERFIVGGAVRLKPNWNWNRLNR